MNIHIENKAAQQQSVCFEYRPKPVYDIVKRLMDIVISLIVGVILIVPILIVAAAIVIKDFGWPFFMHKRVGKNGKAIRVCKFRSMKKDAENLEQMLTPELLAEYKKEYKLWDDPRLIGYKQAGDGSKCFGAKLRLASIDEFPQILVNILILGNMSVVGPRPILQSELEENYSPEEREILLSVKPGLTGYWQAYARNTALYSTGERQKMELYYVTHRSLWFDIKILFKTVHTVLTNFGV